MRRALVVTVDLFFVAAATVFAPVLRDNLEILPGNFSGVVPYLLSSLAVASCVFSLMRTPNSLWRYSTLADYLRLLFAASLIVGGASIIAFLYNRLDGVSRSLPLLQWILLTGMLISGRVARRLYHSAQRKDVPAPAARPLTSGIDRTVLVLGLTRITDLYIRSVAEFAPRTIRIAGLLGQKEKLVGSSVHQYTVLGTPEDVAQVVNKLEVHGVFVDAIVIATRFEMLSLQAQQALLQLESSSNIKLQFLAQALDLDTASPGTQAGSDSAGEPPAFVFSDAELASFAQRPYWRLKRMIDFAGAAALLIVTAPIMLLVSIAVAIDVGVPVTFWQQRPGRGGQPIHLTKFRTMAAAHDSHGRRIPDEKRISAIGRFLRRTRLDELPQLLSILSGDMSFVGPRPLLPIDQPKEYSARLLVRPGLTGWAQVIGGRKISAADKAALDVWYLKNGSFVLDLRVILFTIPMIVFGERIRATDIQRAWRDLQDAGICKTQELSELNSSGSTRKNAA